MRNPVVSLALYTVSSNVDSITAVADADGNLLLTVKEDDNYEDCQFNGQVGDLPEWVAYWGFEVRVDYLTLNFKTMNVDLWEKQVSF